MAAIEESLWEIAQDEAARQGFEFGPASGPMTQDLIAEGAQRLRAEGAVAAAATTDGGVDELIADDRQSKVDENLRTFVSEMARAARERGADHLREDTFAAARASLCPGCWPFC